jgi:hypothetical protein
VSHAPIAIAAVVTGRYGLCEARLLANKQCSASLAGLQGATRSLLDVYPSRPLDFLIRPLVTKIRKMSTSGLILTGGNISNGSETLPLPLCLPQVSHGLT